MSAVLCFSLQSLQTSNARSVVQTVHNLVQTCPSKDYENWLELAPPLPMIFPFPLGRNSSRISPSQSFAACQDFVLVISSILPNSTNSGVEYALFSGLCMVSSL